MNKVIVRRQGRSSGVASDQVMFSLMHAARAVEDRLEKALGQVQREFAKSLSAVDRAALARALAVIESSFF